MLRSAACFVAAAAALLLAAAPGAAAVRLVKVGELDSPVFVTAPPGDERRLFVVEQSGRIRVLRDGVELSRSFLNIQDRVLAGGERGLLSMAFAPDYEESRRFYVYFTDNSGDIRVEEYRRSVESANRADSGSRRVVLTQRHRQFANHNGGQLQFGPRGLLYIGLGDGGGANDPYGRGQDLRTLLGKLLRIDPRPTGGDPYRVPDSNPFVDTAGARPEIYARGLRNPFRFSFDRSTGDIAIGDVGQAMLEEVDFMRRDRAKGANFGWDCYEGTRRVSSCSAPGHDPPAYQYGHSGGRCAITGGYVVRDLGVPELAGRYVYADVCSGELRSLRLREVGEGGAYSGRSLGPTVPSPSSFGEDARGRVHVTSLAGGVYRLSD